MLSVGRYSTESNVIYSETNPIVAHYVTGLGVNETAIKLSGLDTRNEPLVLRRLNESFQVVVQDAVVADFAPGTTTFARPLHVPHVEAGTVTVGDVDVSGRVVAGTTVAMDGSVVTVRLEADEAHVGSGEFGTVLTGDASVTGTLDTDLIVAGAAGSVAVRSPLELEQPVTCHEGIFVGRGVTTDWIVANDASTRSSIPWLAVDRTELEDTTATDVHVTRSLACDLGAGPGDVAVTHGFSAVSSRPDLFKMSSASDGLFVHNHVVLSSDRRLGLGTVAPAADIHLVSGSGGAGIQVDIVPFQSVTNRPDYRAFLVRAYEGQSSTYNSTIRADTTAAVDDPSSDPASQNLIHDLFYVSKTGTAWARDGLYTDGQVYSPAAFVNTIGPADAAYVDVQGVQFHEGGVVDSVADLVAGRLEATTLVVTGTMNLSESSQLDVGTMFRYTEPVEVVSGERISVLGIGDAVQNVVRFVPGTALAESIEDVRRVGDFVHTSTYHTSSGKEIVHDTVGYHDDTGALRWKLTERHVTQILDMNAVVYSSMRDGVHYNHVTEASYVAGTSLRVVNPTDGSRKTAVYSIMGSTVDYENNERVGPASGVDAYVSRHVLIGTDEVPVGGSGDILCVEGSVRVSDAVKCRTLVETSDARLKTDVRAIMDGVPGYASAVEALASLRPVEFAWRDSGKRDVGFLAQEVAAAGVHPGLVSGATDGGLMGVHYARLVPLLVEAVRELSAEVARLRADA